MKTLIILNGECNNYSFLRDLSAGVDRIVCADGGYNHALKAGISVDLVVGDFDSVQKPDNVKTITFPAEKDLNDAEIAAQYALENYGNEVIFTCALGGRFDHQLFNLLLLLKYQNASVIEENVNAFLCDGCADLSEFENNTVSIMPVGNANITLIGFKYPLKNRDIKMGETLTLSNIAQKNAKICVNSGKVIVIVSKTDF